MTGAERQAAAMVADDIDARAEVHIRPAPSVHIPVHLKQRGQYLIGMIYCLLRGDTTAASLRSIDEITSELVAEAASQISGYSPGVMAE